VSARYDGLADWYDDNLADFTLAATDVLDRLLGKGRGACLDLCCGTGLHFETLRGLGWRVTGVDISTDQLRLARERAGTNVDLVQADVTDLPFEDESFDAAVSMFTHTDVDDFGALLREATRTLRPDGRLVYVGLHPCFVGPHSRFERAKGIPTLHLGYRKARRYDAAPGISADGLRARVGAVHLPLEHLLGAFLDAGLVLERFEEHGEGDFPPRIAVRARP
jgi:SAM-dependent methyltransferase